jgi:hypothetical protein
VLLLLPAYGEGHLGDNMQIITATGVSVGYIERYFDGNLRLTC